MATTASPPSSRERLIEAAAELFAKKGLTAATTREIAQAAGVNEVTLFRLFQNKQKLLESVLERVFGGEVAEPPEHKPEPGEGEVAALIRRYAWSYHARLSQNLALLRVLVGEIQLFQEHEQKVLKGIFGPARLELLRHLRNAQKCGLIRSDVNPSLVVDHIGALVFMGALRDSLPLAPEYSLKTYLGAAIAMIVRGIECPAGEGGA
jgi:AcrR family transcriptional regulator